MWEKSSAWIYRTHTNNGIQLITIRMDCPAISERMFKFLCKRQRKYRVDEPVILLITDAVVCGRWAEKRDRARPSQVDARPARIDFASTIPEATYILFLVALTYCSPFVLKLTLTLLFV
jgi:hypothetical protein